MVMLLLLKQEINAMILFTNTSTRAKGSIQLTKMVREAIHFKKAKYYIFELRCN